MPDNTIVEAIKECFRQPYTAVTTKYKDYDPFKGHVVPTAGKSYFRDATEPMWFAPDKFVKPDADTIICTGHLTAPNADHNPDVKPVMAGYYVVTTPHSADASLKIRLNHNELQFFGREGEWEQNHTPTTEVTVVLSTEGTDTLLATAFPGPAGVHNDQKVLKTLAKATNLTVKLASAFDCNLNNVIIKSDKDFDAL